MKTEEEESAPRSSSGGVGKSKKAKSKSHNHIGPNVRAFRAGRAFCPVCDAEKASRRTERDVEVDRDFTRTKKVSR